MHHAYVIEDEIEEGILRARAFAAAELGLVGESNPDVIILRYGLLSVELSRELAAIASQAPSAGDKKVVILAASRMYHEAQNALLKLFEEPARGTTLFLILPSLGMLLPTLRSRVQIVGGDQGRKKIPESAEQFLKASKDKRSAIAKKLAIGKDEDERREHRDEAIEIVNGVELAASRAKRDDKVVALLSDISMLRNYLYDRAAPVRLILEHLAMVLPKELK